MSALVLDLGALQATVKSMDEQQADLVKRAGYPGLETTFCYEKKPWKEDDAVGFKANPTRSHRARLALPGEAPEDEVGGAPESGFALVVLLRQVRPGQRLKITCWKAHDRWSLDALGEAEVHAWFDAVMQKYEAYAAAQRV